MKRVRFLEAIGNTASGSERTVSDIQARHLISGGHARYVESPEQASPPAPEADADTASTTEPSNQEIREWAAAYGLKVSDRGKIAKHIRQAYEDAHYL